MQLCCSLDEANFWMPGAWRMEQQMGMTIRNVTWGFCHVPFFSSFKEQTTRIEEKRKGKSPRQKAIEALHAHYYSPFWYVSACSSTNTALHTTILLPACLPACLYLGLVFIRVKANKKNSCCTF